MGRYLVEPDVPRARGGVGSTGLTLAAAALGLVLLVAVGVWLPGRAVPPPAAVATTGAVELVCPVPADGSAELAGFALPGTTLAVTDLEGQPVPGEPQEPAAGTVLRTELSATTRLGAAAVEAGTVAGILTRTTDEGPDPGLSQTGCATAGSGGWLVGLRSSDDEQALVVLTNPDPGQAVVNLTVRDADGLRQVPGSRDVTVPGGSVLALDLGPLLAPEQAMAVQAATTTGRVDVRGLQRRFVEDVVQTSEWLTPSAEPATEQVLAGVPGGEGARELVVVNPGERRLALQVEALGEESAFVPAGVADSVDIAPGATVVVELDDGFSADDTALRLQAEGEFTAALNATDAEGDLATVPATAGLLGAAVGDPAPLAEAGTARLLLANAGTEPARVMVGGQAVELAPGTSRVLSEGELSSVEVLDEEVHASLLGTGGGVTSLPLQPVAPVAAGPLPERDPRLG